MTKSKPISLTHPKLLIGEGIDEARVFGALLEHAGLDERIQVLPYHGKSKLGPFLRMLPKLPGFDGECGLWVRSAAIFTGTVESGGPARGPVRLGQGGIAQTGIAVGGSAM